MRNVYSVLGGYCNLRGLWIQGSCLNLSPSPPKKIIIAKKIMKLHTQRGQFLLDISTILHRIGMGVSFNENGTSKCTSGANYICISVLRVTQGSYCHMRPVYKGSSDQAPVCKSWVALSTG